MEESYQKIVFQKDVEREIKIAESESRDADFSNQTIHELNLSEREIRCGLNFKNAVFLGSFYLGRSTIIGDLIIEGAVVNNALYFGELEIKGSLIASRVAVKNSLNIVGGKIEGSLDLEKAHIQGFLSLNKSRINGRMNAKGIKVISLDSSSGIIKGDFYMQNAEIEKSLDLEWSYISGMVDFQKLSVWEFLNFSNSKIGDVLILRDSYIKGESLFEDLECKEKIVSF